jgi:hypothetical protein
MMKAARTFGVYYLLILAFTVAIVAGRYVVSEAYGTRALTPAEMARVLGAEYKLVGCNSDQSEACLGEDGCIGCVEGGGSCPDATGTVYSNQIYTYIWMEPIVKEIADRKPDVKCFAEGMECIFKVEKIDHQCGDDTYCVEGTGECKLCGGAEPDEEDWETREDWHCQPCP